MEGEGKGGPQVTVEPGPLKRLATPLCHFSNIDVASKYCLYYVNYLLFGQFIIKIFATGCRILRLKCTEFDFGWGSAPDPAVGANSAPPDPLAGLRGPTSKGRGGEGGRGARWGGEGEEGRGEGKGKVVPNVRDALTPLNNNNNNKSVLELFFYQLGHLYTI